MRKIQLALALVRIVSFQLSLFSLYGMYFPFSFYFVKNGFPLLLYVYILKDQSHEYHVNGYVFFIMVTLLYLYEPAWLLLKPNIAQMKMYDIKLVVMLAQT